MVTTKYTNVLLPQHVKIIILPATNIASENKPSQKEMSFSNHWFSGAFAVSFRKGKHFRGQKTKKLATKILPLPGDSVRDLLIPDRWRSPTTFRELLREVTIPKRSWSQNCQVHLFWLNIYLMVTVHQLWKRCQQTSLIFPCSTKSWFS